MLKNISRKLNPLNVIPITILSFLIIASVNIYVTRVENESSARFESKLRKNIEENSWDYLSNIIISVYNTSLKHTEFVSARLENSILRSYPDLDVLKKEFETRMFSKKFHDIMKNTLEKDIESEINSNSYLTFVGLNNYVMAYFTNTNKDYSGKTTTADWDTIIYSSPNKNLSEKSFRNILNNGKEFTVWQTKPSLDNKLEKINETGLEAVKKAYELYGVEAFKYYDILTVSYITDSGDIFNTDDKTYMNKNKNFKLVIVQSFNLYELLEPYLYFIDRNNIYSYEITSYVSENETHKEVKTILLTLITFLSCVLLIKVYNRDRENATKEEKGDVNVKGD